MEVLDSDVYSPLQGVPEKITPCLLWPSKQGVIFLWDTLYSPGLRHSRPPVVTGLKGRLLSPGRAPGSGSDLQL